MPTRNGDGRRGRNPRGRTRQPSEPKLSLANSFVAGRNLDVDLSNTERERAANLLKDTALFRNLSRRVLIDVVARSTAGRLLHTDAPVVEAFISEEVPPQPHKGETTPGQILAIVVLKGTLIAAIKPTDHEERKPYPLPLPKPEPTDPFVMELPPGVHFRASGPLTQVELGKLRLEPPQGGEVDVLVVSSGLVDAPAASWGINTEAIHIQALTSTVRQWKTADWIWMGAATGSKATVEALTHILAGKVATDYPSEPVLLFMLGATWQLLLWKNNRFENVSAKGVGPKGSMSIDINFLFNLVGGRDKRARFFFLNPDDPLKRPGALGTQRFDRVVYLTDEIPSQLPQQVRDILRETLISSEEPDKAHLSSFLPSILCDVGNSTNGTKQRQFKAGNLRRRGIKLKTAKEKASDAFMCCVQDSTFLPFGFEHLEDTWNKWQAGGGTAQPDSFLAVALGSGAISESVTGTWGRAVTNRRVGVACSGGGASAYRIGPVLQRIEAAGIPVDVFTGLSGGALVGAFYSRWGMEGFNFARDLGPFFQLTMPLVLLWTRPFEWVIDLFLEHARVEDLDIRFAAVAAALPETERPSATVVVHGTLGEAVRASGCLPPSFAPTDKDGVRYTDGGAGTAVPAQVARDCGADVVLACNVIPGPARGNPFSGLPLGWLVRKTPLLGRLVDNYTWYAFFMAQTSRAFGASADVFVEFKEQDFPLLESSAFIFAKRIIQEAEKEGPELVKRVNELNTKWQAL